MDSQPGVIGSPTSPQGQVPLKFSRYRSVRQAAAKKQQEASTTLGVNQRYLTSTAIADDPRSESATMKPHNESIARSMSRYRRGKSPAVSQPPLPESRPPLPQLVDRSRVDARNADRCEIGTPRNVSNPSTFVRQHQESESDDDEEDHATRERNRREAMQRLTASEEREIMPEKVPSTRRYKERADHDRHRDMKEPGRTAEHAVRRDGSDSKTSQRRSLKDRVIARSKSRGRSHSTTDDRSSGRNIEPKGGGVAPGFDAPVSAVNAGERKVTVKCNETGIILPVTPTTRAHNIITFACNSLSEPIDPQMSIVVESFSQLGLERPLRRYEHVRDVLNSWDYDGQNSLFIIPSSTSSALDELDAKAVPEEQPEEATFHIYHSQRPGKWEKRYVTLRADGQIVMAKKQGHEQTNVCHLSDFDIYSPTPRQLEKKIKPPKKICFAVKSQQKSSMFLSTENFVHFFATNHRDIASQLYKAVQGWRSWYLVNVLGEDQRDQAPAHTTEPEPHQQYMHQKSTRSHAPPSVPKNLSLDTQYLDSRRQKDVPGSDSSQNADDATFSPTGLLGRTYSQRQRLMREREGTSAEEGPFSPHGLLSALSPTVSLPCSHPFSNPSSRGNSRTNTMRSTQDPDISGPGIGRSISTRQKPLVDLTPVYQEPLQHARKGHGITVAPGVPLIDAATGPELAPGAIVVPSATTWRRPPQNGGPVLPDDSINTSHIAAAVPKRSNTTRSRKPGANGVSSALVDGSVTSPDNQFAPNSLLARADKLATAQGDVGTGHGVASGDRHATKPLLDLTPQSQFAEGSLLRQLESS
ncbi:conserved hypothetical protein [Paecilomyces variotii No. 5]|uniref:PH domain-containing protein n=1 Tax=Byssochlamys spectabilis (strain No. 5 / NBRC 109023) TaxID=1356009 RepID=V5FJS0_BYSSN|nr:conserved hypothetical protein [Paecilomyces variotii No. 5]